MASQAATDPLDKAALKRLAVEQPRPVLPLLARANDMGAMVVVLALLPALYAVSVRTLTDEGAIESLHFLNFASSNEAAASARDATETAAQATAWQPPLTTWLAALAIGALGKQNPFAFVCVSFLAAAGTTLTLYLLARRLGGHALGLTAAALWAFNPHALLLAQEPHIRPLASALALLTLTGIVAHWQKVGSLASLQLLLAGLALGLCLLAGGPVAVAVVLVLLAYVLLWKLEAVLRARRKESTTWERSQQGRKVAIGTVSTLAATAFAVGGWWLMLMSARHGKAFWNVWLGAFFGAPQVAASSRCWLMELCGLALPTLGLALLGCLVIVQGIVSASEDPGRRHRGLLLVWTLAAFVVWLRLGRSPVACNLVAESWQTFLALPLVLLAAHGLLAIAERRTSFAAAIVACAVSLLAPLAVQLAARHRAEMGALPVALFPTWAAVFLALLAMAFAVASRRAGGLVDSPRRRILQMMLTTLVAANVLWGVTSVNRAKERDAELAMLGKELATFPAARRLSVVDGGARTSNQPPPAALLWKLACSWPGVERLELATWQQLLESRSAAGAGSRDQVIIVWSQGGRAAPKLPAGALRPVGAPLPYSQGEATAYVWSEGFP